MGLISKNRPHLRRCRQLPCVGPCGVRRNRYAITSHSFPPAQYLADREVSPKIELRRAPSVHCLIMDNTHSRAGATPHNEFWYALQGYNLRRETSPVRILQKWWRLQRSQVQHRSSLCMPSVAKGRCLSGCNTGNVATENQSGLRTSKSRTQ